MTDFESALAKLRAIEARELRYVEDCRPVVEYAFTPSEARALRERLTALPRFWAAVEIGGTYEPTGHRVRIAAADNESLRILRDDAEFRDAFLCSIHPPTVEMRRVDPSEIDGDRPKISLDEFLASLPPPPAKEPT